MGKYRLLVKLLLLGLTAFSSQVQAATYYWVGGASSGWNTGSNWSTSLGGSGGVLVPGAADNVIFDGSNIGAGATGSVSVSFDAGYTVGGVSILNFGANSLNFASTSSNSRTLTVQPTVGTNTFTLAANSTLNLNGLDAATDRNFTLSIGNNVTATIDGTLTTQMGGTAIGTFSNTGSGVINFTATGIYIHNINGGTIPTATWNSASECRITGILGAAPTFPTTNPYGKLTLNAPGQSAILAPNATTLTVASIFRIVNTGSGAFVLRSNDNSSTLTVGTLQIDGGTFRAYTSSANNNRTIAINATTFNLTDGVVSLNSNSLNASSTASLNVSSDFTQSGGSIDLAPAGSIGNGNIVVGGNFTQSGAATLFRTAGNVASRLEFTGAANALMSTTASSIGANVNVTINKTAANNTVTLSKALTLPTNTTLTLATGILALNGNTLNLGSIQTVSRTGNAAIDNTSGTLVHGTTTHVNYVGGANLNTGPEIPSGAAVLGNLTVSVGNSNIVTLGSNATANTALNITSGTLQVSGFNLNALGTTTINTNGTLNDDNLTGTNAIANLVFSGGTLQSIVNALYTIGTLTTTTANGTIGACSVNVTGVTTVTASRTLTFSSATGTKTFSDIIVNGTWTNSGNAAVDVSGTLTVNTGATFTSGTGLYTLSGINKNITGTIAGFTITNLTVSGSYTQTVSSLTATTLNVSGTYVNSTPLLTTTLNLLSGGYLNTSNALTATTATINAGGQLDINAGITFTVNGSVANAGIFKVLGTSGNPAVVTRVGGNYTINQSAGTFHAQYYNFTNLGTNGITLTGGSIDATNNFSNGTFGNNSGTANAYLTLTGLNFSDFTVSNVVFGAGATSNVVRTAGSGIVTFANATGVLAGYAFEGDSPANGQSTGLIQWATAAATYYWVGGAVAGNWNNAGVWATTLGGTGVPAFSPGNADVFIIDGSNIGAGATGNVTVLVNANYIIGSLRVLNFGGGNQATLQPSSAAASTVTLTISPAAADVFTLASGSTLNISGNTTTRNLNLIIGTNATATIDGILNIGTNSGVGAISTSGSGILNFSNSGVYVHAVNGGTIPTASWGTGSECRITGTVATAPTFPTAPVFGNLTWNAPAQTVAAAINLPVLTVVSTFKMVNTNSGSVVLRNSNAASTLTVGTFQVDGGIFTTYNAANANTIDITANQYTQSSGTVNLNASTTAGAVVNFTLSGNFTQTGGTYDLAATGATGTGVLYLSGNLIQSGSAVLKRTAGAATSRLELNGAASTINTYASGLGAGLHISLNKTTAATTVQMLSNVTLPAASSFTLTNGILNLNNNTLTYGAGVSVTRAAGALNTNGGSYAYAGTIDLTYIGNQDLLTGAEVPTSASALNNFTVSVGASNIVTLNTNAQLNGNLSVNTGTFALGANTANRVSAGGTLSVSAGAFLLIGGTGTFPVNYTTNTLAATSTVNYNGANQTVKGALTYGNLNISGSGIKTLDANVTGLAGNVTVSAGTFDLSTFTANRSANTTTFTVASGAILKIGGTSTTFPSGYTTYVLTGSTVEYYGSTQTVAVVPYHHVTISGAATNATNAVAITGDVLVTGTGVYNLGTGSVTHTIAGTLTVSGSLLYGASGNQVLTVTGNLSGAGILNMNFTGTKTLNLAGADNAGFVGTFTAGAGTVNYTRSGNQTLFAGTYNTLGFTNTGNRTLSGVTNITQNFTVPAGISLLLNGFNATALGTLTATGTITVPAGSTLTSNGAVTVGGLVGVSGTSAVFTASANVTINAAATLSIGATAVFNMNGATLANNGTLSVVGTLGSVATVTRSVAGNYVINQTGAGAAAAVFAAKYYVFNALGTNGITISNGSIDAVNNLSNGTYQNGAGTAYLTLTALNFSNFTASNVVFEGASAPTYNVVRTSGTGSVTFQDYSGARSGQSFESDNSVPGTLIVWNIAGTVFYSQNSGNFYALATWNSARDGSGAALGSLSKLTDGSNDFVIQGPHVVTVNNNVAVNALKVESNGALVIGDASAVARTIAVNGNLEVQNAASVVVSNFNAVHTFNFLGSTFVNNGTFNLFNTSILKSATFNFNGVNMTLSGSNAPTFASVNFNNQAPPYTNTVINTAVPLVIKGNVVFVAGAVWNDGGLVHTVGGNWQQATAAQLAGTGTIKFNGSGTQQISNAATFNHLTFEGGNAPNINGAITVNGKMYITGNTNVSTATSIHTYNGDFTVDAGSSYNQTTNTATFGAASTQNIDFSNATFNTVIFTGAGLKATVGNLKAIAGVTINAGTTVDGSGTHTITGNFIVNGTSAWTGLVTMTGGNLSTANATLALAGPLAVAGNVSLVNTVAANPIALTVNGDLNITSGTLTIQPPATVSGTAGYVVNVLNGAAITLLGANNFPTGFDSYNFVPGATANYTATTAQSPTQVIAGDVAYANLTIQNNTKTAGGNLSVLGNLTFTNTGTVNTTFDLKGKTLAVGGNIVAGNTGTTLTSTLPGSILQINGANSNQSLGIATYNIETLVISQANPSAAHSKTFTNGSNITVLNFEAQNPSGDASNRLIVDLTGNVVTAAAGASTFKLQPNAGLYTSGISSLQTTFDGFTTIAMHDSSFVRYNSTSQNQIIASKSGVSYGTIELAGSTNKTATSALDINGNLLISANTPVFVDGGFNHTIAGNWSLGAANYSKNLGSSGTITMDGLNQSIVGNVINVVFANGGTKTVTTSNLTVQRNLTINNGVLVDANLRNITMQGDWTQLGTGAFVQTTGTTTFNGISASPQNIAIATPSGSYFGNLTISRGDALGNPSANIKVVTNSSLKIGGTLRLVNFNNEPTCSIVTPYAHLDISDDTLTVGGSFVLYPSNLMTTTNSTLQLQSEQAQNFYLGNAAVVFNNMTFLGSGLKTFMSGNIGNNCGIWTNPVVLNGNWKSDLATVNAGALPVTVNGNWYNTGDFQHGNTVTLLGSGKTISNSTFNNLTLGATASYTLLGDITTSGAFTVSAGGALDVSASNFSITVAGNYVTDGTVNYRNNTVYINSGGNNLSSGKNIGNKFHNLEITNTACGATTTLTDSLNVNNNLTITAGRLTTGVYSIRVGNNFYNNDQYNQSTATARLTFDPVATGTRSFVATTPDACGASTYGNTVVNIGAAKLVQTGAVLITANTLRLQSGIYKMNGNVLDFSNSAASILNISPTATLDVDSGAALLVRNTVLNHGVLKLVGTPAAQATLGSCTTCGTNNYTILQNGASAVFHAKNYLVQSSGTSTTNYLIDLQSGSLDAVNNLSNGSFSSTTTGGTASAYIRIGNAFLASDVVANGVVFNSGKPRNVEFTANPVVRTISFQNSSGSLAGATYETDVPANGATTGNIRWTFSATVKFWDGNGSAANTSWNTANNWFPDGVPTATDTVYIDNSQLAASYAINIDVADTARVAKLIMQRSGANTISLNVLAKNLKTATDISIAPGCTLNGGTGNIRVGGSWSNGGTFTPGTSLVVFRGISSSYNISNGTSSFYNISLSGASGAKYVLGSQLTVNTVTIDMNNTLDVSSSAYNVTVTGDWINNGTFNPRSGSAATITFNRAGAQAISKGPFNNFTTAGTGIKSFGNNITIYRTVTIGSGTVLDAGANSIYVGLNWVNNATGGFTQASDQFVYFNGGNQSIDNGTLATTFSNAVLLGTGTKTLGKNSIVNGEFLIAPSGLVFNMQDYQLVGNGTTSQFNISSNSTVLVGGTINFLNNFATTNLAVNSTIRYQPTNATYDNAVQTIMTLPNGSAYGNLDLRVRANITSTTVKSMANDITIAGNLSIADVYTQLLVSGKTIRLSGDFAFPNGGTAANIVWGSTGTLIHNGTASYTWQTSWNIDADIPAFNHLILAGSQRKNMNGNLVINGSLTIQGGVTLNMNTFTATGTPSQFMLMQNASRLESAVASPALAFPTGFGTYNIDAGSATFLNADGAQDVFTTPKYGNLTFSSTNTSTPLRPITLIGGNLSVTNDLNFSNTTFIDNNFDVTIGGNLYTNDFYVPSTVSKLTLNGDNQVVQNPLNNATLINLNKLTVTGTGVKTLGNGAVTLNIESDLFIDTSLTLTTVRPLIYSGASWNNQGLFSNSNVTTFDNAIVGQKVLVNPGLAVLGNAFGVVNFNTADTLVFVNNGGDFNGAFNINSGVVHMGNGLTHTISGVISVYSTTPNPWFSNYSHVTFDGGTQSIPVALVARNVVCANAGTKTMQYSWYVDDLTINSGVTLTNAASDTLFVAGSYINNGTYNAGTTLLLMNATSGTKTIKAGASSLYDLSLIPSGAVTYDLTSPTTRVSHAIEIKNAAKLKLHNTTLIHGNTGITSGKVLNVSSTASLEIGAGASLLFDNRTSVAVATIDGLFKLQGVSDSIATLSRSNTGGHVVLVTGNIDANYYLIEYMSAAGLQLSATANILGLSNGTFSNLNAAAGSAYISSNITSTPGPISNVNFNYSGTPVVGNQYNVKQLGASTITFVAPVAGALSCPTYKLGNVVLPNCTVVSWIGVTDSDWNKGTNWSTGMVPDSSANVFIPIPAVPNQGNLPVINISNAVCRNLTLTNGSLSLATGGLLDVKGDVLIGTTASATLAMTDQTNTIKVKGNWTKSVGSFNFGPLASPGIVDFYSNGSVTINNGTQPFGSIVFSGSGFYNLANGNTINATANSFSIKGSLTQTLGTVVPSTGTLFIEGNFTRVAGNYSPIGTVNFTGATAQTITAARLNNVVFSAPNTRNISGDVSIAGTASMTNGSLVAQAGSVISFGGNVNLAVGTTFDVNNATHNFTGTTWTGSGATLGNGFVSFNAGNQNLAASNMVGVIFAGTGTKTLTGNVAMTGDFFIKPNITVDLQTFVISNASGTSLFDLAANSRINLTGANNFPAGFVAYTLACNSTVNYNSSVLNQTVAPVSYGHLIVTGGYPSFRKNLGGNTDLCGNLTIAVNTTLDVTTSNYNLTIGGNFNNNSNNGSFRARQGSVIFNGAINQGINLGTSGITGTKDFYTFIVDKPAGSVDFQSSNTVNIREDVLVSRGTLSLITPDTVIVGGNFQAMLGAFANGFNRLLLKATVPGDYLIRTNGSVLYDVIMNSPGSTYDLVDNTTIYRNLDIKGNTTLDVAGLSLTLGDDNVRTANVGGTLKIGASGKLIIDNGYTFNVQPTGAFELIGVPGNIATVTSTLAGARYNFNVDGKIAANNYLFEYMRSSGISLSATAVIAPRPNNFSEGTFANGTSGGVFLKIENTQYSAPAGGIDTIMNVSFNTNPGGGARNVAKTSAMTGRLIFHNASGSFAGPSFENDPFNLIDWTGNYTLNWTGAVSSSWYNPLNWSPNLVPTVNDNAVIPITTNQPVIDNTKPTAAPAICKNLTIILGANVTLKSTDAMKDLIVANDITINGILKLTNSQDTLSVGGNWLRGTSGSVISGNGSVVLVAPSGVKTINNRTSQFGNLIINGAASFQLGSSTTIGKSLVINTGTLDVTNTNNYNITVGGDWINKGQFLSRGGTVTLNGQCASTYLVKPGLNSAFNNLTVSPCSSTVYNLNTDQITINGTYTLNAGTFNLNALTFNMGNATGSEVLNVYGTFNVNANASLLMATGASVNVQAAGHFRMIGIDSINTANVGLQSTGNYGFIVNSGGTISGDFYTLTGLNASGLLIRSGATINSTYNLSNGVYANGAQSGYFITLEHSFTAPVVMGIQQCDTIRKVTFSTGASKNVFRTTGTGCVTFKDSKGPLSGYLYEKDELAPNSIAGRLRWSYSNPTLNWTGAAQDGDWFNPLNWKDASGGSSYYPDATTIVIVDNAAIVNPKTYPTIKSSANAACPSGVCPTTATALDVNLTKQTFLTVDQNRNLNVGRNMTITGGNFKANTGSNSTIDVGLTLSVENNAAITGTFSAGNAIVNVYKDFKAGGLFRGQSSTVRMMSPSGTATIYSNGVNSYFSKLFFMGGATFLQSSSNTGSLKVKDSLSIHTGATLLNTSAANSIALAGSWTNNGTFTPGPGRVSFDTASATRVQYIGGSTTTVFNILNMNGQAEKRLMNHIQINGTCTIGGVAYAIFNMNGKNIAMNGSNFTVSNVSSQLRHGGSGTVTFATTGTQTISISGVGTNRAFFNVLKTGSGVLRLGSNVDIDGTLTVSAGSFSATTRTLYLGGDWINNGTFVPGSGVIRFDGVNQNLSNNNVETFHNLVAAGSRLTITGNDVKVNNSLNIAAGIIVSGSHTVELTSATTGSTVSAGSYVDGYFLKNFNSTANKVMEVGTRGVYTPITVTPATATAGNFRVRALYYDAPTLSSSCLDTALTVNRYWDVTKTIGNYNATFTYTAGVTNVGVVPSSLGLYNYSGGIWTTINTVVPSPTATSLSATALSLTGHFQIAMPRISSVTITSSVVGSACSGSPFVFTANPVHAGATPSYQWRLNNGNVGTNSPTYAVTGLLAGDVVNVIMTDICGSIRNSNDLTITIGTSNTWSGATNTDWFTASNWSCGIVPNSTLDVTIPSPVSNYPQINATANVKDIQINNNASLTLLPAGLLNVSGNWTNNGSVVPQDGSTVRFDAATGTQNIGGTAKQYFYNLQKNNAGTLRATTTSSIEVRRGGVVKINAGVFDINGKTILLKSKVSAAPNYVDSTASLGSLGGSLTNASNFTIERYNSAIRGVRYIGAPVTGMTFARFKDSIIIAGPAAGGFDAPYTNAATAKDFLESRNYILSKGFVSLTNVNTAVTPGKGYYLFVPAKRTTVFPANEPVTFLMKGTPITGNFNYSLTYTPTASQGWNLIANPYPSAVDWDLFGSSGTNLDGAIYIWDPRMGSSGAYYSYVSGIASDARANGSIISSSQGFFVKASGANPTLSITENAKVGASFAKSNFRQAEQSYVTFKITNQNGDVDFTTVRANELNGNPITALKLENSKINLYTLSSAGVKQSINSVAESADFELPLYIQSTTATSYTLEVLKLSGDINTGAGLKLRDEVTGDLVTLTEGLRINFAADGNLNKYTLLRTSSVVTSQNDALLGMATLQIYPNPNNGQFTITGKTDGTYTLHNELGTVMAQVKLNGATGYKATFSNLGAGVYTLRDTKGATAPQKIVVVK